ncbi:U6 snRNA-associated Sm-like protein LSm4 [Eurosta solidaginis]|uniref:U6 snRNA-associated Sm-like protein LSm4 n=1 Tax=Eurosta solidaginis TaxID=178769 RepID=UPI0035317540
MWPYKLFPRWSGQHLNDAVLPERTGSVNGKGPSHRSLPKPSGSNRIATTTTTTTYAKFRMLVELKNGETYNGHLVSCDSWMNINLRDVICTSKDGDRFWRMPECYVRGSTIKYLRIPDEVIDMVKDDVQAKSRNRSEHKGRIGVGAQNQSVRGQLRPRYKNVQENGMKSAPRGQSGRPVTHNSAHKNRK